MALDQGETYIMIKSNQQSCTIQNNWEENGKLIF